MAAAPPAAPAAPAKPAAAPAPAPAAPAAVPPTPDQPIGNEDWIAKDYSDLEALSDEQDAKDEGREAKPAAKKSEAKKPEAAVKPPEEKPAGEKPVEKPAGEVEPEPKTNPELRKALEKKSQKLAEIEPRIAKYEARIKELEAREPEEVTPLREKLTAAEKRLADLEGEIVFVNYSKSQEFQTKYAQPYINAFKRAMSDISQLEVELADGTKRAATQDDFLEVANAKFGEDRRRANALFGDNADDVMAHARKVRDLAEAQDAALTEAREKGLERTKQERLQSAERAKTTQRHWQQANADLAKKYPNWFAPVDGDAEGNEMLSKGFAMADKLFAPATQEQVEKLTAEGKIAEAEAAQARLLPKTPEEAARLHALIRNKVANHDRLALSLKKANARIKELEKTVADYEGSEPPGGAGGERKADRGQPGDDWNAEIDEMDKKDLFAT